jgi:hypothetical protein
VVVRFLAFYRESYRAWKRGEEKGKSNCVRALCPSKRVSEAQALIAIFEEEVNWSRLWKILEELGW